MNRVFFYITLFFISTTLLFSSYNNKSDYESIYKKSLELIQNDEINQSIVLLEDITSHYKNTTNQINMNAHYDLGNIYLSRLSNYELAAFHFEFIYKGLKYNYSKNGKDIGIELKSLYELKLKSLFMLGYIYHNHLGNFSKAKDYYNIFLKHYKDTDLASSVIYELEIIEEEIKKFNLINK
tara:strand:+ start:872 stop:1414 length:543 start_codon:yes stop_codon:yes gene_type:complete